MTIKPPPIKPEQFDSEESKNADDTNDSMGLNDVHPKVKGWLVQHKQEQRKREHDQKAHRHDKSWWGLPLLADLTPRDLYRFRMTSNLFKAFEKAGGKIGEALISGKVTFLSAGQKIECSIVEKMHRPLMRPEGAAANWTAYPENHQSGLHSSGFLRVSVTTWLPSKQPQWIETPKQKISDLLSEIVSTILATGPILIEDNRRREEQLHRYQEEAAGERERHHLKQLDELRWARFRAMAADREEHFKLLKFLEELKTRISAEDDGKVCDKLLSEWIAWAQEKIDELDPFRNGISGIFESVSR